MPHRACPRIISISVALLTLLLAQSFATSASADTSETASTSASSTKQASISGGVDQTCVILSTTALKCWGSNTRGQLGDNSVVDKKTPIDVSGLSTDVASISTGGDYADQFSCAVLTSGTAKCWGSNSYGQLGDNTLVDKKTPLTVTGMSSGVAAVSAGVWHMCGLLTTGAVKCWGWNGFGAVGDNTDLERHLPTAVVGLSSGVTAITTGTSHSCALLETGGVKCWGWNESGQVGDNTLVSKLVPTDVTGLSSGVAAISAGTEHTCALLSSGGVKCWGRNQAGQLGDNTLVNKLIPTDVTGLSSGVTAISSGLFHTCALLSTGGVKCWGSNNHGQLGDDTLVDKKTPVDVVGLSSGVVAITAGFDHTCALLTTGGLKCWGRNANGQVGDNTLVDKKTPTDVVGLSTGVGITATTVATTTTTIASTTTTIAASASTTSTSTTTAPAPSEQTVLNLEKPKSSLLSNTSLASGAHVTLTFSGFVPGEFVQLVVASTPQVIASGYANSSGSITLSGTLPTSLVAGSHSLALYAPKSGRGVRQPVTVVGAAQTLPTTGTSTPTQLPEICCLLLVGLMLVMLSRRRLS